MRKWAKATVCANLFLIFLLPIAAIQLIAQTPAASIGTMSLLEAARTSLLKNPQLHLAEQQVVINQGVMQQAAGAFDRIYSAGYQQGYTNSPLTTLQQEQALASGIVANTQGTNLATFNFSAPKLFRNGIEAGPAVQSSRTLDNLSNFIAANRTSTDFDLSLPLLRNRGADVVDAQERSAGLRIEASRYDLRQAITDLLAGVATAYWQYVAANQNLQVALGSEDRGRTIRQNMQQLIDADHAPRADIYEADANLADRVANRVAAQQQIVLASQQLALAMGLAPSEMASVEKPGDDFPPGEAMPLPDGDPAALQRYIQEALNRRADLKAGQKRIDAAVVQKIAAANQTKPLINLTFTAGFSGLDEGPFFTHFLNSPFHRVRGADVIGGISFSINPGNNTAKGQVIQANAAIRQAQLQIEQASQSVASSVVVAIQGLRNAQAQLTEARRSVEAFHASLDSEREKLRLGIGSVVDILTVEDRLTSALATQVQARLNYALALTQLRQATGTLVDANQTSTYVDRDVFFTAPFGSKP